MQFTANVSIAQILAGAKIVVCFGGRFRKAIAARDGVAHLLNDHFLPALHQDSFAFSGWTKRIGSGGKRKFYGGLFEAVAVSLFHGLVLKSPNDFAASVFSLRLRAFSFAS